MRNANPRDGEIGRSWGKWFHKRAERSAPMAHVFQRMDADDRAIKAALYARGARLAARIEGFGFDVPFD